MPMRLWFHNIRWLAMLRCMGGSGNAGCWRWLLLLLLLLLLKNSSNGTHTLALLIGIAPAEGMSLLLQLRALSGPCYEGLIVRCIEPAVPLPLINKGHSIRDVKDLPCTCTCSATRADGARRWHLVQQKGWNNKRKGMS